MKLGKLKTIADLKVWELTKEQALQFVKDNFECDITDKSETIRQLENIRDKFWEEARKWSIWSCNSKQNGLKEDADFEEEVYKNYSKARDMVCCLKRIVEREE